jgi:hypothetical protein
MKLNTNFSFSFNSLIPTLVSMGWGISLLGVFFAVAIAGSALRFTHENPQLQTDLEKLSKAPMVVPSKTSLPSSDNLDDLRRHLKGLNSLQAGGGRSVASLLARLEDTLLPSTRLLSFQQDQQTGEIQLVVEALNLEDLSKLLAALETDTDFSKVTLTKQSQSQNGQANWIQFSVDLIENRP